jgi:hypothetical protein
MTQALYEHMNNKTIKPPPQKKKKRILGLKTTNIKIKK